MASIVCLSLFGICLLILLYMTVTSWPIFVAAGMLNFKRTYKAAILALLLVALGAAGNIAWVVNSNSGPQLERLAGIE